jgi:hypothetical protein
MMASLVALPLQSLVALPLQSLVALPLQSLMALPLQSLMALPLQSLVALHQMIRIGQSPRVTSTSGTDLLPFRSTCRTGC